MNDKLAWYISRSSGWVAFVLLAVTVVWGILGITKVIERKGLPRWMMDLHKYLALLTVAFTAVHLGALVADNFVHIAWREILVPYALDWKPGAVTFGIVAMYLIVAVQVSSWLRPRLPRKVWKATHMLSYPAMWLVAMHGLRAGTDASNLALRVGVMVIVGATAFVTLLRIVKGRTARRVPVHSISPAELHALIDLRTPGVLDDEAVADLPVGAGEQQPAYVAHVREAMDSLRDALRRMQDAAEPRVDTSASARIPPVTGPNFERRHEARTLVDDVPPSV
jgi:methionine sulfoxide reductase heme-binding subunit